MWAEFRAFLVKTNAFALAIAVIIAVALGAVVTSLVNDILMPPIGLALGGVDFGALAITLREATGDKPAVAIRYGGVHQHRDHVCHHRVRGVHAQPHAEPALRAEEPGAPTKRPSARTARKRSSPKPRSAGTAAAPSHEQERGDRALPAGRRPPKPRCGTRILGRPPKRRGRVRHTRRQRLRR